MEKTLQIPVHGSGLCMFLSRHLHQTKGLSQPCVHVYSRWYFWVILPMQLTNQHPIFLAYTTNYHPRYPPLSLIIQCESDWPTLASASFCAWKLHGPKGSVAAHRPWMYDEVQDLWPTKGWQTLTNHPSGQKPWFMVHLCLLVDSLQAHSSQAATIGFNSFEWRILIWWR